MLIHYRFGFLVLIEMWDTQTERYGMFRDKYGLMVNLPLSEVWIEEV